MFTSQSLTRSGALNTNTGCQECVRVFVCTVSEQEHTWDAVSGGPKSLSCFRAPLSGSSPALATLHPFVMYLCIDRKGDGSGCQSAVTRNPPPHHHQSARGGVRTQAVRQTEPGVRTYVCKHGCTHTRLWGKCPPLMPTPGLCLLL